MRTMKLEKSKSSVDSNKYLFFDKSHTDLVMMYIKHTLKNCKSLDIKRIK